MPYILSAFADEAAQELDGQIAACLDNSIKWIEIRGVDGRNISELTTAEAGEARKRLDEAGIKVSAIGSPFGKYGINEPFTGHLDSFRRMVETAIILGAKLMRIFSFYIPQNEPPVIYRDEVMKRLGLMLDCAGNVTLCHENEKNIYGDVPERCRELYDAFSGRLRLVFDPANFVQCGVDVWDAFRLLKDGVEYIHVKDCDAATGTVVLAGHGDGCLSRVINEFYHNGKTTFLSVEPHLKVFDGYDHLGDGRSIAGTGYRTTGEAFKAAVSALRELLQINGFKKEINVKGGYAEWIR